MTSTNTNDEPVLLTYDEAVALLPDGNEIHTVMQAGPTLIGADWDRKDVLTLLRESPRRDVTDPAAQKSGHVLAAYDQDGRIVFIETKDQVVFTKAKEKA